MDDSSTEVRALEAASKLRQLFFGIDTAQTGVIPRKVLEKKILALDPSLTPDELDVLFNSVGESDDGTVNYNQFIRTVFFPDGMQQVPAAMKPPPDKKVLPKRVILIRHGESQGNVNRLIYETVPDNQIHLTRKGWEQGMKAGSMLKDIIGDEPVIFMCSPYVRTRETLNALKKGGSFNERSWQEDARIREQDFCNFQDTEKLKAEQKERQKFGKFFYRHPNGGESPSDMYDRITAFIDTMYRVFRKEQDVENYIIVSHGVTIQVFLMRWFHLSVDDFNNFANPDNCEFCVLERCPCMTKLETKMVVQPAKDPPVFLQERRMRPIESQTFRDIREEPPDE